MSSIGVIWHRDGQRVERGDLERMGRVLGAGTAERVRTAIFGSIGFVHCLRRFTPEDALEQQPIAVGERYRLVWEGRIDNRDELAADLGLDNDTLRFRSDSQLFADALDRWNWSCLNQLVGEFSCILFDKQSRTLNLIRDHLGMRSLLYYHGSDVTVAATTYGGLFALPWVPKKLNEQSLADTLAGSAADLETTYYENIMLVPPAHRLRLTGNGIERHRFWDINSIPRSAHAPSQGYAEGLRDVLTRAVQSQLRASGIVGSMITGGLDSSSVAVTAARLLRKQNKSLPTFTAVPEAGLERKPTGARYFDETALVKEIASITPNLEPHFIRPADRSILGRIDATLRLYETPFGNALNVFWAEDIIKAARKRGVRVLLNGECGNNTISHSGFDLLPQLLLEGHWFRLVRELSHFPRAVRWRVIRQCIIAPLLPRWFFRWWRDRSHRGLPIWASRSFMRPEFGYSQKVEERAAAANWDLHHLPNRHTRQARARGIMAYADMAPALAIERAVFGIDARSPTLDRRVVEYALSAPTSAFLKNGTDRRLVCEAMCDVLPESVLTNRKVGEQSADWHPRLSRELSELQSLFARASKDPIASAMIDTQRLSEHLENWPVRQIDGATASEFLARTSMPRAAVIVRFLAISKGWNQ